MKKQKTEKRKTQAAPMARALAVPAMVCAVAALLVVIGVLLFSHRGSSPQSENDGAAEPDNAAGRSETSGETAEDAMEVTHYARITIRDYGTITVALYGNAAPITVENFVSLAEEGFYDGLTFHRIIEGFMMQGGDPNGNGTGGSGKTIVGEFADNGVANSLSHTRGALSMARASSYDSASSQFFITHGDCTALDGQYAVFGYVTEGMDVVDAVCESAEPIDGNGLIAPEKQPVITGIVIEAAEK